MLSVTNCHALMLLGIEARLSDTNMMYNFIFEIWAKHLLKSLAILVNNNVWHSNVSIIRTNLMVSKAQFLISAIIYSSMTLAL